MSDEIERAISDHTGIRYPHITKLSHIWHNRFQLSRTLVAPFTQGIVSNKLCEVFAIRYRILVGISSQNIAISQTIVLQCFSVRRSLQSNVARAACVNVIVIKMKN